MTGGNSFIFRKMEEREGFFLAYEACQDVCRNCIFLDMRCTSLQVPERMLAPEWLPLASDCGVSYAGYVGYI